MHIFNCSAQPATIETHILPHVGMVLKGQAHGIAIADSSLRTEVRGADAAVVKYGKFAVQTYCVPGTTILATAKDHQVSSLCQFWEE